MRDFRWIYTLPANFPSKCSFSMGYDSNPCDLYSYRFYLFSDGFQDQFGGDNDRKYSTSCFKDLLIWPSHLPMPLQREKLNEEKERTVKPMIFWWLVWRCREKTNARRGFGAGFM